MLALSSSKTIPMSLVGVPLLGSQSDRLLSCVRASCSFFLLQVGAANRNGGVGTRTSLSAPVVLDGFRHRAALKLVKPQRRCASGQLVVDFDCVTQFLESSGRIARGKGLGLGSSSRPSLDSC